MAKRTNYLQINIFLKEETRAEQYKGITKRGMSKILANLTDANKDFLLIEGKREAWSRSRQPYAHVIPKKDIREVNICDELPD